MKKLILTLVLLNIMMFTLLAEVQKVAIVKFDKNDRPCDYVYKEMTKRDFESVFKDNENLELISLKDAEKAFKKSGFAYMGRDEARTLGTDLEADFVLWGSVSSVDNTVFKVQLNVYSIQTADVFPIIFNVTKNKNERRAAIAENLLTKLEQSGQAEVQKLMDIGLQHFNSKNLASAEESFKNLIRIDPVNIDAYFYLGVIKFLNKEYEESIEYYLQGLELDPQNTNLLDYLSRSYLKVGYYEEAVEALEQITELVENTKEIWFKIGNIYAEIEYYGEAETAYETALEIDDEYAEAWMALGVMLFDIGSYESAIVPLEKASTAYPDIDHLQKKLATCYMRTGKLDDAIARYKKVLLEKPDNINAYMNLANAYRVTGQDQAALETLTKLKNLRPDLTKVYLRLAETYLAIKNYDNARKMSDTAIQQDPQNYEPYLILAQISFNLGYQKYEKFLWYEEEYKDKSKYYGEAADKLVEERDKVKEEAFNYFLEEEKYLNTAESLTSDPSVLKDIRNRREILNQLKAATKPGSF